MSRAVDVDPGVGLGGPSEEAVVGWALAMLDGAGLVDAELSVVLLDDDAIATLNAQWRGKDGPTDVLSFPQQAPDEGPIQGGLLGDVVISVPTASRQAAEHGHDLDTELRVLLAHGIAHLLGHDHHDPASAGRMGQVEGRLLAAVGMDEGLVARAGAARAG